MRNPAGLVSFIGKPLRARYGMQADSCPCEPSSNSRAAANGSFSVSFSVWFLLLVVFAWTSALRASNRGREFKKSTL